MRVKKNYALASNPTIKQQLLTWAQQFDEVVWLDSNDYYSKKKYEAILAVSAFTAIKTDVENAFAKLHEYQSTTKDWIFGYLTYDLKEDTEQLSSNNYDGINFPDLYFFQPQKLIFLQDDKIKFHYLKMVDDEIETDFEKIKKQTYKTPKKLVHPKLKSRISKKDYLQKVEVMKNHIQRGDIYEANFCQEFYLENTKINPLESYFRLNEISTPPFASFLKLDKKYALCASPERYLQKEGDKIISQPIKGTAKRLVDKQKDLALAEKLQNDAKEISENVMIVDLVRNDLSRTAQKGSVEVEELCGLHSFKQVHQLISTVSSRLKEEFSAVDVLKTTFPMGSMTGAPKISAMKIIEKLEETKRGLYSGSIGYFTPDSDFDFNVVIRTILYNSITKYTSCSVGGAITSLSVPVNEYEECLTKIDALKKALRANL
ncbi:anthranilate synthase component I family protein [Mesonia sp. K7]|uniref:anthranilate synthase component I family protein n=1 Tax=Mesonia sp. K7 TaxID=2218606 RepID=UPI000DA8475D|nr:anthranilate synthase component I family protein [Mesonia sp. K7]PZD76926.1 aminodeoxychorismate synthase component I [Mesonia sp. K7]